jgi:hypothetical protein
MAKVLVYSKKLEILGEANIERNKSSNMTTLLAKVGGKYIPGSGTQSSRGDILSEIRYAGDLIINYLKSYGDSLKC